MGVPGRACDAVHEVSLLKCDFCGKDFRRREYLGDHLVLFMRDVLLYCDIWEKDCRDGDYLNGHIITVHGGMASNVLFVLLFIYYIGGVKTCWKQLQSEGDFCDVTLVCDDGHIKTHKFIISSYSPFLKNILNVLK